MQEGRSMYCREDDSRDGIARISHTRLDGRLEGPNKEEEEEEEEEGHHKKGESEYPVVVAQISNSVGVLLK